MDGNSMDSYFPMKKITRNQYTIALSKYVALKNTNRYSSRHRTLLSYNIEYHEEEMDSAFTCLSSTIQPVCIIFYILNNTEISNLLSDP